jgi:hypothetical protein
MTERGMCPPKMMDSMLWMKLRLWKLDIVSRERPFSVANLAIGEAHLPAQVRTAAIDIRDRTSKAINGMPIRLALPLAGKAPFGRKSVRDRFHLADEHAVAVPADLEGIYLVWC